MLATVGSATNTLNHSFRGLLFKNGMVNFFVLSNFDKPDKMQLLAKFKKVLDIGFRATLNFQNFRLIHAATEVIERGMHHGCD